MLNPSYPELKSHLSWDSLCEYFIGSSRASQGSVPAAIEHSRDTDPPKMPHSTIVLTTFRVSARRGSEVLPPQSRFKLEGSSFAFAAAADPSPSERKPVSVGMCSLGLRRRYVSKAALPSTYPAPSRFDLVLHGHDGLIFTSLV